MRFSIPLLCFGDHRFHIANIDDCGQVQDQNEAAALSMQYLRDICHSAP
jgi:hypothetical protein